MQSSCASAVRSWPYHRSTYVAQGKTQGGNAKKQRSKWEEESNQRQLEEPASDCVEKRQASRATKKGRSQNGAELESWRLERKRPTKRARLVFGRRCIYAASLSTHAPRLCGGRDLWPTIPVCFGFATRHKIRDETCSSNRRALS